MPIRNIRPGSGRRPHAGLYNEAWKKASAAWLREYPFCVLCLVYGQINQRSIDDTCSRSRTLVVDHIEPHRGDIDRFWDQDNWQTLCRLCHDRDKARHERRGGTAAEWFALLRDVMQRHDSREHVQAMAEWLPPGVGGHLFKSI